MSYSGKNSVLEESLSRQGFDSDNRTNSRVNNIARDLLEFIKLSSSPVIDEPPILTNTLNSNFIASASAGRDYEANRQYLSEIEASILRSAAPIEAEQSEEITVNGQRGVWLNKAEVLNWRGQVPINEYQINQDQNPDIVTKQTTQILEYVQELAIRYLRPPTPPAPGEIVITQEANTVTPPAPPLIIRQQPPRPTTPEPIVVREAPPPAPPQIGRKVITISGKRLPPPPRKVVIERLAPLPSKPQSVIVERWLPYSQVKRRVIYQKKSEVDPVVVKPKNVIIQWEAPRVVVRKDFKYLGVIRANPVDYVNRYGPTLKQSHELPDFVTEIKTPDGLVLAADYKYNTIPELEGDIQALKLIDLEREGLGEYRSYLSKVGVNEKPLPDKVVSLLVDASVLLSRSQEGNELDSIIERVFISMDTDGSGSISVEEAGMVLLKLNSRLSRRYGENDLNAFFNALDVNGDGQLNLNEFRRAFINLGKD